MSDQFTEDLRARLSGFIANATFDSLSDAFAKANFETYRYVREDFFGILGGEFGSISASTSRIVNLTMGVPIFADTKTIFIDVPVEPTPAADHQDLELAA